MTNDSAPAVPESERCAYIYRYWGENVCDEPPDAEVHWASNNPTITPHRHAFVAPAASEAPADPEPRCKAHERQYPCHICNPKAPADDLEVSPALERFRKKAEAATAGNYCVSCGRSFGGPTITREQFASAVDAWRKSYGQKENDATDDEIAYGLKHALAAAGIAVAE